MRDITDIDSIKLFVDGFYGKVRRDSLIGPVFLQVLPADWQPHLDKMYAFWNAVLFGVAGFKGNPFSKHAPLKIEQEHFDRWLALFGETIEAHFEGPVAGETKKKAGLMAEMFLHRLRHIGAPEKVVV
jgi:hemoglobin